MENAILEQLHAHASVRHYKPDPVPAAMVETIVAAAQCASTSSNMQSYSVVAVTDPDRRTKLASLCGDQQHIQEAPVFLAWCADLARMQHICALRGCTQVTDYVENFLVAAVDAALASQNAAAAAESLGLGVCYIGYIRNIPEAVIDLLQLPPLVFPITGMTLGYPSKPPHRRPRLPLASILHWDTYHAPLEDDLRAYDRAMLATGIYKGRQVPVPGKPGELEEYGWLEHSARRASQAERTGLRAALEKQGFGLK